MKQRTTFVREDGVTVVMEDGVLESEVPAGDGMSKFYHENGVLRAEVPKVDGQIHGYFREWHDNGQLSREAKYVYGKIEETVREWDRDGSLLHELDYVLYPTAVYYKTYADVGKIRYLFLWNGQPISKSRWLKKVETAGIPKAQLEQRFATTQKPEAD